MWLKIKWLISGRELNLTLWCSLSFCNLVENKWKMCMRIYSERTITCTEYVWTWERTLSRSYFSLQTSLNSFTWWKQRMLRRSHHGCRQFHWSMYTFSIPALSGFLFWKVIICRHNISMPFPCPSLPNRDDCWSWRNSQLDSLPHTWCIMFHHKNKSFHSKREWGSNPRISILDESKFGGTNPIIP